MKQRRQFLKKGISAATAVYFSGACNRGLSFTEKNSSALMSAATSIDKRHYAALLNSLGEVLKSRMVPERGHGAVYDYHSNSGIFIARRPGRFMYIVPSKKETGERTVEASSGRHFYGHATIVDQGKILLTTENNYQSGRGVIVYRDIKKGFKVVKEVESHGIGPHELVNLGDLIAIANGGLRTHPDSPRQNLNIDSMQPNLSFIDWQTGQLVKQFKPEFAKSGIRHLAKINDSSVAVAIQSKDSSIERQALVYHAGLRIGLKRLQQEELFAYSRKHYTASIACSGNGLTLATFPRGRKADLWQGSSHIKSHRINDVAGATFNEENDCFYLSNGIGEIYRLGQGKEPNLDLVKQHDKVKWDNHLLSI